MEQILLDMAKAKPGHMKTYHKNQVIHLQGDPCQYMEMIMEGAVRVESYDEAGHLLLVETFGKGSSYGGNLLFSEASHYPMTITAAETTKVIRLKYSEVVAACKEEAFLLYLLGQFAKKSLGLAQKIRLTQELPLEERIISYLENLAELQGTTTLRLPMTKKALAAYFFVERTSLSRAFARLRDKGLIAIDNRMITLYKT